MIYSSSCIANCCTKGFSCIESLRDAFIMSSVSSEFMFTQVSDQFEQLYAVVLCPWSLNLMLSGSPTRDAAT